MKAVKVGHQRVTDLAAFRLVWMDPNVPKRNQCSIAALRGVKDMC